MTKCVLCDKLPTLTPHSTMRDRFLPAGRRNAEKCEGGSFVQWFLFYIWWGISQLFCLAQMKVGARNSHGWVTSNSFVFEISGKKKQFPTNLQVAAQHCDKLRFPPLPCCHVLRASTPCSVWILIVSALGKVGHFPTLPCCCILWASTLHVDSYCLCSW